ncbi:MAG: hypothetical protein K1X72_23965 [Pyrinomonadaceae bacterium]|nr:hypothetical protein [Pyrinomonadaceae bacterium]
MIDRKVLQKNILINLVILSVFCFVADAQILTKQEMANLAFSSGYTGVGNFPPLAIVLPKNVSNQAYLLVKETNDWKKRKFDCLHGVSLSNDGKIWVVSSRLVDGQCIYQYDLSYSPDGGKTWNSSGQGFNPSLSGGGRLIRLDVDKRGNGNLILWAENDEDDHGFYYLVSVSDNTNLSGLKKWATATTNPNGNTIGSFPEPIISKGNIVVISESSFSNSDTYGTVTEWLPKLAKMKGKERKRFPE